MAKARRKVESKRKGELPDDIKTELDVNDSFESRIELLLIAILRELKRIR